MEKIMNEAGNEGGSVTVALPSRRNPMTDDFDQTRRDLIAMRVAAGANTPKGHACSNLIEQLDNYRKAEGEQKQRLAKAIREQMVRIATL